MKNHIGRAHCYVFGGLLAVFSVLTFLALDSGLDQGRDHLLRVVSTTLCTVSGPLTGAIARDFQSCCLSASLVITAYCGPILVASLAIQFIGRSERTLASAIRMLFWIAGWTIWFLGGLASFFHALG